jgi:hypothetical protein
MGATSKCHFVLGPPSWESRNSQNWDLRLLAFWRAIIFYANLWLRWGLKKSCNPCQNILKYMWHGTCTQVNHGDSQLLMIGSQIGSQIGNLTFNPFFGHNLCFRYSNGSYEPISDIFVSRVFQRLKKKFNPMSSNLWNRSLKIWKSIGTFNSQSGSPLGSVWANSLTLSYIPMSMKCDFQASLLAHTFTSPYLNYEPKVKVVT